VRITVIIPTYRRPNTLRAALESLRKQTQTGFQILVVDNAAEAATESLVGEFNRAVGVRATYVAEARLGVHFARNTAGRVADGDLLLYADDDVTFDPEWVAAYDREFERHQEMAAAGGPVRPVWEMSPPRWLLDFIGDQREFTLLSFRESDDHFVLSPAGTYYSCNMAVRKSVLLARGGFHPEATGERWVGDGETGLLKAMWAAGDLVGSVPEAVAYHHIPASRMTVRYLRRRMANEGAADVFGRYHPNVPRWPRLLFDAAGVAGRAVKFWAAAPLLWGSTDERALRIRLHAARTGAQFRYLLRLLHDPQLRAMVEHKDWFA
jgi:glycosyltransferase involved in cell wall biosynthesis